MNMAHWEFPLSSSDPAAVEKSLAGMRTSLHNAKLWGCGCRAARSRSCKSSDLVPRCLGALAKRDSQADPLAAELKVVIAIEEVWNKFLLSPLEMATLHR